MNLIHTRKGGKRKRANKRDEETSEEVGAPMRSALALLNAPVAALANPSTPLPDELREVAARLLKVVLRREMIDAQE